MRYANGIDPAEWVGLVYKMVGKFAFHQAADHDDAIQNGMIAMMGAARKWRVTHESNATFMTYACNAIVWSVRQSRDRITRRKRVVFRRHGQLRAAFMVFFSDIGDSFVRGYNRAFATVAHPADDSNYLDQEYYKDAIADVLRHLAPRERLVLRLRFGVGGDEPTTLEQTARLIRVTKERVRQIEARAILNMRYKFTMLRITNPLKPTCT